MLKIIFLDIDGVLNCQGTFERLDKSCIYGIDQRLVKVFNKGF